VAPGPPAQPDPATSSNTVVPNLSQRQIRVPTLELMRTPDSWKSSKTRTPKKQLKYLFIQQILQFPNQTYIFQDPPNSWSNVITLPTGMDLRAQQEAQRLHNQRILQENRARNECRIHMQQRAQNKAQKFLMDGMLMKLEARSKGFDFPSYRPLGNFYPSFNSNYYIDNLSQIPSQDQQEYSNDIDQYQMQRDDDHDSNDDVFGEPDLIQIQIRGLRGKRKKCRGRSKVQSQTQPLQSSHEPIQESI
ncbi:MAG: hypothetical protein EZS28_053923, partial [Streblomastix strix]